MPFSGFAERPGKSQPSALPLVGGRRFAEQTIEFIQPAGKRELRRVFG